ncbi:GPI ethanolamine phosphate transferase 2 [Astathelohania contejeani]|uniref:GPI ethanolamine phosphate transferase 2 n=1 Tax=Astathelohania contejeani TaxID=164912 RepID=A0ABQ7HWE8_9MICR|nr:GPI ethanolamine phosphate transferase 2 [Thelohania contejeani]
MKYLFIFLNFFSIFYYFTGLFKQAKLTTETSTTSINESIKPKYKKLVFILFDGLRYDAVVPTTKTGYYYNKMKFLSSVPGFKALSLTGSPTCTSSRVDSILTGIPTNLLNGLSNFINRKCIYDNFVKQAIKTHTVGFYGDSTWLTLVEELHGVPGHVMPPYDKENHDLESQVMKEFLNDFNKYEIAIGHFFYLDHIGHHLNTIESVEIEKMLLEYDKFIENLYKKMDDDTLLVILSDHGVNNDGSHGGSKAAETAAFSFFIDKRGIEIYEDKKKSEIRENYLSKFFHLNFDWISSINPITLIHQNDIIPTFSVLLDIPIPFHSYGNLIHELVPNDENLYKNLAHQKMKSLEEIETNNSSTYFELCYVLSERIYSKVVGHNYLRIAFGLLLSFFSFFLQLRMLIKRKKLIINMEMVSYIASVIVMVSVAFSVHSFIHEDLFWVALFLFQNFSKTNFLICFIFLFIGRFPQNDDERFILWSKIPSYYTGNFYIIIIGVIYLLKVHHKNLDLYHILILILRYFNFTNSDFNISLISHPLDIKSIICIIFNPRDAFFIVHIVKHFYLTSDPVSLFALTNMSLFYSGMCHDLSCIDYDIPFIFSNELIMEIAVILMLIYFIYPRISVMLMMKNAANEIYYLLVTIHLFIVQLAGVKFMNNFLFFYFFGGRLVFVTLYGILESIMYAYMGVKYYNKMVEYKP